MRMRSNEWPARLSVLNPICVLICCFAGGAAGDTILKEPFDDSLTSVQLAIVSVVSALTGALCLGLFAWLLSGRTARLSFMMALLVWCSIFIVVLVTTSVMYSASRTEIQDRVDQLLVSTASIAGVVQNDFNVGPAVLRQIAANVRSNSLDVEGLFPVPQLYLRDMYFSVINTTSSIFSIYFGTEQGSMIGFSKRSTESMWLSFKKLGAMPAGFRGCEFPYDAGASLPDVNCTAYRDAGLCGKGENDYNCTKTCDIVDRRACALGHALIFDTKYDRDAAPEDLVIWPSKGTSHPFDPRGRPWYNLNNRDVGWSDPYVYFLQKNVGLTSMIGLQRNGTKLGVAAVDYTLTTMGQMMRSMSPSRHGHMMVIDIHGVLLASGLPEAQLQEALGGISKISLINVFNIAKADSPLRLPVEAVVKRFRALSHALAGTSLMQERGNVVVSVPVDVGNLQFLLLVTVPHSDMMESAVHAFNNAVYIGVGISVADVRAC